MSTRTVISKTAFGTALLLMVSSAASTAEARKANGSAASEHAAPAPPPPPAAAPPVERAEKADSATRDGAGPDAGGEEGSPPPEGFSIGARIGYALPMGSIAKDASLKGSTDLSGAAAGMVPLWADVGYRLNPRWYVGGYFQFGIVGTSGDLCKQGANNNDCSSSGNDLRFGIHVRYTFSPGAKIAPWAGISSGYEVINVTTTVASETKDTSVKGWEFIGLHLGADLHAAPAVSIGPVLMASFGQYGGGSVSSSQGSRSSDYTNPALHEWVFLGIRGQYDL